jgi:hypothetical protein
MADVRRDILAAHLVINKVPFVVLTEPLDIMTR